MNYIVEINLFNEFLVQHKLSTAQIALWYALIHIANKNYWPEWMSVCSKELEQKTGLSRYGIIDARKKLEQLGLVEVKSNSTKAVSYRIISLKKILHTTQYFQQDNAIFSTSLCNIFNKTTSYFPQVKAETSLVSRGRSTSKTKNININNIYSKNKSFRNYEQRAYEESQLNEFYCNEEMKGR